MYLVSVCLALWLSLADSLLSSLYTEEKYYKFEKPLKTNFSLDLCYLLF